MVWIACGTTDQVQKSDFKHLGVGDVEAILPQEMQDKSEVRDHLTGVQRLPYITSTLTGKNRNIHDI